MAAKDYEFVESCFGNIYLAKKTKGDTISQDCRLVTDNEIIGMFHRYLKRKCKELDDDTVVITTPDGEKSLFEAKLYDFKKIEE